MKRHECIAATDDGAFVLFDRPAAAAAGWRSLKLVCTTRITPKHNWWLAWNGERLARNRDAGLLAEHKPDVYAWVVRVLEGGLT